MTKLKEKVRQTIIANHFIIIMPAKKEKTLSGEVLNQNKLNLNFPLNGTNQFKHN